MFDDSADRLYTYYDGVLCDSTVENNAPGNVDRPLYIGSRGGTGMFSNVMMDDVRIWKTALGQSTIQSWMYREVTSSHPNWNDMVGYWKLDEGSGTTATDSKGSNGGTLHNMTKDDWVSSAAPIGNLTTHQNDITAMWSAQTDTASDNLTTGLDIANVTFTNDVGDDIIFGHNNAAFDCCVTDNLSTTPNAEKRWARLWELDVNDNTGTTGGNVELTFDISEAGGGGNFSGTGNYYLLKRDTGSSADFTEINTISTIVSGDQITFRVNASNLGSEFTLGADTGSPTAITLRSFTAYTNINTLAELSLGLLGIIASGVTLILWKRRV